MLDPKMKAVYFFDKSVTVYQSTCSKMAENMTTTEVTPIIRTLLCKI